MKHTVKFDLSDDLDKANFDLFTDRMKITANAHYMLNRIIHLTETKPTDWVEQLNELHEDVMDEIRGNLYSYNYIVADGMCDECQENHNSEESVQ